MVECMNMVDQLGGTGDPDLMCARRILSQQTYLTSRPKFHLPNPKISNEPNSKAQSLDEDQDEDQAEAQDP